MSERPNQHRALGKASACATRRSEPIETAEFLANDVPKRPARPMAAKSGESKPSGRHDAQARHVSKPSSRYDSRIGPVSKPSESLVSEIGASRSLRKARIRESWRVRGYRTRGRRRSPGLDRVEPTCRGQAVHRPRSIRGGAGQIASRPRRPEGAGDKSCHGRVETRFAEDMPRFETLVETHAAEIGKAIGRRLRPLLREGEVLPDFALTGLKDPLASSSVLECAASPDRKVLDPEANIIREVQSCFSRPLSARLDRPASSRWPRSWPRRRRRPPTPHRISTTPAPRTSSVSTPIRRRPRCSPAARPAGPARRVPGAAPPAPLRAPR